MRLRRMLIDAIPHIRKVSLGKFDKDLHLFSRKDGTTGSVEKDRVLGPSNKMPPAKTILDEARLSLANFYDISGNPQSMDSVYICR